MLAAMGTLDYQYDLDDPINGWDVADEIGPPQQSLRNGAPATA
jgi:hypothetical protein